MSEEHSVSCECSVTSESPFCRVSLLPQNFHSSVWEGGGGGLSEEASSPFKRRSLVSVCLSQIAGPEPGLRHLCCFCSGSHGDFADDRESWIWGGGVLGCWLCSSLALYLSHGLLNWLPILWPTDSLSMCARVHCSLCRFIWIIASYTTALFVCISTLAPSADHSTTSLWPFMSAPLFAYFMIVAPVECCCSLDFFFFLLKLPPC